MTQRRAVHAVQRRERALAQLLGGGERGFRRVAQFVHVAAARLRFADSEAGCGFGRQLQEIGGGLIKR